MNIEFVFFILQGINYFMLFDNGGDDGRSDNIRRRKSSILARETVFTKKGNSRVKIQKD